MGGENRKTRRRIVRHPAVILTGDGSVRQPCMMVDVSATGAKLEFQAPCEITDPFTLMLTESGAVIRQCQISWRSERSLGVQFLIPRPKKAARS
jgi:hypothetical protein